jgi:hypothetical protein
MTTKVKIYCSNLIRKAELRDQSVSQSNTMRSEAAGNNPIRRIAIGTLELCLLILADPCRKKDSDANSQCRSPATIRVLMWRD